jgi:two-component system, OmpR family, response regulator CpxR
MKLLFAGERGENADLLDDTLSRSGMTCDFEPDVTCVLPRVRTGKFDLLILDSCQDAGFAVLREIRADCGFPVLLITPQEASFDRVRGFRDGADDCISRPFQPEELVVRVEAILRRTPPREVAPPPIRIGDLLLYRDSKRAYLGDAELKLTPMECDILEALMHECGRTVTRDQIVLRLYQREASPFERSVDTHISRIRRKLGQSRWAIISIRGSGYQLCKPSDPSDTFLHQNEAPI